MGKYDLSNEAEETDLELGSAIEKLGALTDSKIAELLPNRVDQDELSRLIKAVNEATSENGKKTIMVERLGTISSVVKDVVLKLV